ncbi:hypothetical protein [Streptomyces cyaneofuscatus]|uniref:hypothetical protein n=1 Tax=Streptomyces cyaneofuscatus TaxID=66883 RepID=UPI0036DF8A34
MATKTQLAAEIIENRSLRSVPVADAWTQAQQEKRQQKLRRQLERMPKAELVALHAEYHHISDDTAALVEMVTEALNGRPAVISVSRGVVRVEQPTAEMNRARISGHDDTVRALGAAGFTFDTGGCTCFIAGL